MPGPPNTHPSSYTGTHLLGAITRALKETIEALGGPDVGITAPFLTLEEYDQPYWSPEMVERVATMYQLQITMSVQ